jgi:hypothetical protein
VLVKYTSPGPGEDDGPPTKVYPPEVSSAAEYDEDLAIELYDIDPNEADRPLRDGEIREMVSLVYLFIHFCWLKFFLLLLI